jgi:hypothetical protein
MMSVSRGGKTVSCSIRRGGRRRWRARRAAAVEGVIPGSLEMRNEERVKDVGFHFLKHHDIRSASLEAV